jgi:uncharacterized protein YkwD
MRPSASLKMALLGLLVLVLAAPAYAAGPRLSHTEHAIVRALDWQRTSHGLPALRASRALSRAADMHSREMVVDNYFAHSSANGSSFTSRLHRFTRAHALGETLAMLPRCGRGSARRVVSMWMHSWMHRAIILTGGFHHVGVGLRTGRLGSHRACLVTADFSR